MQRIQKHKAIRTHVRPPPEDSGTTVRGRPSGRLRRARKASRDAESFLARTG
jgi:hypothetical protein